LFVINYTLILINYFNQLFTDIVVLLAYVYKLSIIAKYNKL